MPAAKKFAAKTHLSPSRRRALSQNFVKTPVVVQPYRQAAPLLVLPRDSGFARCEKKCEEMKAFCALGQRPGASVQKTAPSQR